MTIKSWGTGRPDYMKAVVSSRPVIVDIQQIRWLTTEEYSIAAGAVAISNIYTIPVGYSLSFGGGYISVKDSCINKLRLVANNDSLIGEFRFDMRGDFTMTSLSGQELSAGTVLAVYVFNNDTLTSEFSLTLTGVLSKVRAGAGGG